MITGFTGIAGAARLPLQHKGSPMDADLDYRIYAEPDRVIVGIEEEVIEPEEYGIITQEDGTRCKVIRIMKAGEKVEVCVPLGADE
jgi:hypothetical protein